MHEDIGAVPYGPVQRGQPVPFGLVGQRLDVAVHGLQDAGLETSYDPVIPDSELPLRNWGVCSTSPVAGRPSGNGVVVVHIGHLKCGGGSDSAVATDSTPGEDAVRAAWRLATEALVRADGPKACADMTTSVRRQFAVLGRSCQEVVRTQVGQLLTRRDVRSVTRAMIFYVEVQSDQATVYYYDTIGFLDLGTSVNAANLNFDGSNNMQHVHGKWLLAPN